MTDGTPEAEPQSSRHRRGVTVSERAAEFIRERGGSLYIWTDAAGMLRNRTEAPTSDEEWNDCVVNGVCVRVAPDLAYIRYWRVEFRRFPLKHLDVTSSASPPPVTLFDEMTWFPV